MSESSAAGWSSGTAPDSARFSKDDPTMSEFGVKTPLPPHSGLAYLKSFEYTPDKISVGIATDQEWSVSQAAINIVKGTMDLDVAKEALKGEGVYPVQCIIGGKPKAMVSIWINDIGDSVCGTYNEIVISFDVHKSDPNKIAFDDSSMFHSHYAFWYNNFGSDICEAQYLHTLYIDSKLSIMWAREMQAFPKHPELVESKLAVKEDSAVKSCDVRWKDDQTPILSVETQESFGFLGFCKEGLGLVRHMGVATVAKFLGSSAFETNIVMPAKTAAQNNRTRDYTGHIWKGLNPTAVKVWPWNKATDKISWNAESARDTGCEDNNVVALLEKGNFQPLSVCYLPKATAVVTKREMK